MGVSSDSSSSCDNSSDVDTDIQAPQNVRIKRGKKKEGGPPLPNKKARPLVPKNRGETRRGGGRKRGSDPAWDEDEEDEEEEQGRRQMAVLDSDEEDADQNMPPPSAPAPRPAPRRAMVDSDEDDEGLGTSPATSEGTANGVSNKNKAPIHRRKRLSVRSDARPAANSNGDTSTTSTYSTALQELNVHRPVQQPPPDPDTLKRIYSTCMEMYQAQKITVDNAFNIRFLELMSDFVDMPDFDRNDLQKAGRLLEVGAKIYVLRVDKTKHQVLDLASTLKMQQTVKKKKDGEGADGDDMGMGLDGDGGGMQEDEESEDKPKRKRKIKAKDFVAEDSKISLQLETGLFGEARRNALKSKFMNLIDNDVDFDYFDEYIEKKGPLIRPATVEEQQTCFANTKFEVPPTVVDTAAFSKMEYLPMILMEKDKFSKIIFDLWGHRLDESSVNMNSILSDGHHEQEPDIETGTEIPPQLPYVPQDEPPAGDYEAVNDTIGDDRGFGNHTFVQDDGMGEGTQEPLPLPNNVAKIKTLEEFYNLYEKQKVLYSWCPNFMKSNRLLTLGQKKDGQAKRPRTKKEPVFVDILNADKKAKQNKFLTENEAKGVLNEQMIEKWSEAGRRPHPYVDTGEDEDEDFEEVINLLKETDTDRKPDVPPLFQYFVDKCRNILSSLNLLPYKGNDDTGLEEGGEQVDENFVNDVGFEVDRNLDDSLMDRDDLPHMDHVVDIPEAGENMEALNPLFQLPAICFSNLLGETDASDEMAGGGNSVRFTKRPKPIDIHGLKRAIANHLHESLLLDNEGCPTADEETKTDFITLLKYVLNAVDEKTQQHLSISILLVGLLHVVAEKKLFVLKNPAEPINPSIVCRGKLWNHKDHIPMPIEIEDD